MLSIPSYSTVPRYRLLYNTQRSHTRQTTVYYYTHRPDRTRAAHAARVVWPSGLDARANVPGHSSRTRLTRLVSLVCPLPHPCTWLTYSRFTKFMLDCSCRAHYPFVLYLLLHSTNTLQVRRMACMGSPRAERAVVPAGGRSIAPVKPRTSILWFIGFHPLR